MVGLAGREGVGKSTLCAHIVAQITRGTLPGDYYDKPRSVIIVSTEDDWKRTLKPRLVAAGVDEARVFQVTAKEADGLEETLMLPNDLQELERVIRENDVALVILDPLLTLVNAKMDTHKDAEVRRALEPVVRVAQRTGASFIGLIHVNKSTKGDLMNRVMGSRAIGAVCRGVLFCARYTPIEKEPEDEPTFVEPEGNSQPRYVFGQIKNNLGPKIMSSIEYHMETVTVGRDETRGKDIRPSKLCITGVIPENVEDIVLEQERRKKSSKTEGGKAESWLIGYLTGKGEVPSKRVIRDGKAQAGLSRDAVERGRRRLEDRIQVHSFGMPKTTTWELLPEGSNNSND
jgi:hypothetical protein